MCHVPLVFAMFCHTCVASHGHVLAVFPTVQWHIFPNNRPVWNFNHAQTNCFFFVVHLPLPSMYHIFTYICLIVRIFMANVDKHAIHGWYGTCSPNYKFLTFLWPKPCSSSKSQDVADSRSWRRNRQKPAQNGQHKNKQIKITYHNRRSILFA